MTGPTEQAKSAREILPLWSVLAKAGQPLESDPAEVGRRMREILKNNPGQVQALQLLVDAQRAQGDMAGARAALESMAAELPEIAAVHYELGLLLADIGDSESAARSLSRVVELEPKHPQAWRALGDVLTEAGNSEGAAKAYGQQFASSITDLKTLERVSTLENDQMEIAEDVVREFLNIYSTDLAALELLGKMYMRVDQFESAENIFRRALELAPSFRNARLGYVSALHKQLKPAEENLQLDILLQEEPENTEYRALKAAALSACGKTEEAVAYCEDMLRTEPNLHRFWLVYAHTLRVAERQEDCIAAYRKAIELEPRLGEAWWGLANLKTFRFRPADVETMRRELLREDLTGENGEFLHFALGKALEDIKAYGESFEEYALGNTLVRTRYPYDIGEVTKNVAREKHRFTGDFFTARVGMGCPSPDPIFILGLPRSGSTLVEQILASHSSVEGGGELPSLVATVRGLEARQADREDPSAGNAAALFRGENLRALGEEYLERCRPYRKTKRPFFTDKMPSNFHHLGVICTILPGAKIIDARRHPLACCFSNYKQIFPSRQGPSYDLADIGHYYRGYVELLAHFDRALPGRIHRVIYEDLVRNPETEIRRLLDYCGLTFEEACLRFHETDRGIRTISSEQVRRPLYTDSVEQWRNYEQWLGPLKVALGQVLDVYPAVPEAL